MKQHLTSPASLVVPQLGGRLVHATPGYRHVRARLVTAHARSLCCCRLDLYQAALRLFSSVSAMACAILGKEPG